MKINEITQKSQDIKEIAPVAAAGVIAGVGGAAYSAYEAYKAYEKYEKSDRDDAAKAEFRSTVGQQAANLAIGAATGGAANVFRVLSIAAKRGGIKTATKVWDKVTGKKPGVTAKPGGAVPSAKTGDLKVAGPDGKPTTIPFPSGKAADRAIKKLDKAAARRAGSPMPSKKAALVKGAVWGAGAIGGGLTAIDSRIKADGTALDDLDKVKYPPGSQEFKDAEYTQRRAGAEKKAQSEWENRLIGNDSGAFSRDEVTSQDYPTSRPGN
jgi:hypothetical protein